jgi:hypothetical protein
MATGIGHPFVTFALHRVFTVLVFNHMHVK